MCIQAYLLVWLYVGTFNLAGLQSHRLSQKQKQEAAAVEALPAWQAAAGRLAVQGTPSETLSGSDVLKADGNVGEYIFWISGPPDCRLDLALKTGTTLMMLCFNLAFIC